MLLLPGTAGSTWEGVPEGAGRPEEGWFETPEVLEMVGMLVPEKVRFGDCRVGEVDEDATGTVGRALPSLAVPAGVDRFLETGMDGRGAVGGFAEGREGRGREAIPRAHSRWRRDPADGTLRLDVSSSSGRMRHAMQSGGEASLR